MWWGNAMEALDPAALAEFYSTLLEWPVVHQEHVRVLLDPAGHPFCVVRDDG